MTTTSRNITAFEKWIHTPEGLKEYHEVFDIGILKRGYYGMFDEVEFFNYLPENSLDHVEVTQDEIDALDYARKANEVVKT